MAEPKPDVSDLPTNGFIILNRQGKSVFCHGLDLPSHRGGPGTQGEIDLEKLKGIICTAPAPPIHDISVRLYLKHMEGYEESANQPVDYSEVWETEQYGNSPTVSQASQAPDDEVGYTKEIFLLIGVISDEEDHSGDMHTWYGCPLQRNLCIIHLPVGIAWADLERLVTDLSSTCKPEIQSTTNQIDYVEGLMAEWSNLLEVKWFDETGLNGVSGEVCRLLLETNDYDPNVFPPWSDTFDDGATNLRRVEFAYGSSIGQEDSAHEVAVEQYHVDDSKPAPGSPQQPRPTKLSLSFPDSESFIESVLRAAQSGDAALMEQLLEWKCADRKLADCEPNTMTTFRWKILSAAAGRGHIEIVNILVRHGLQDPSDAEPLTKAAECGHDMVVEVLLRNQFDVNSKDSGDLTALMLASKQGRSSTVRLLLNQEGIDVNCRSARGDTALLLAVQRGYHTKDSTIVEMLVKHEGVDINSQSYNGLTPLIWAATFDHAAAVKVLLKCKDVEVNRRARDGNTALLFASLKGYHKVVKVLVQREDVDVNLADKFGKTPLWWAADQGHKSVVELLLGRKDIDINKEIDIKFQHVEGATALAQAVKKKRKGIIELLTRHAST